MRKGRFHSSSLLRQLALGHPLCEVACLLQLVWLMGLSIQRFKKSLRDGEVSLSLIHSPYVIIYFLPCSNVSILLYDGIL